MVKAALLLSAVAGCFWRSYGSAAAAHVDLLAAMAHKGADLVANGRLTAESMPELTYPLERAQAFTSAAHARSRGRPPASLEALDILVARYRDFVDTLDVTRRDRRPDEARTALAVQLSAVDTAAETARAALRAEGNV
ncbi:MAG TPA: hypothetical protein VKA21_12125 [Candidatus Binatia bacterium]|nr:hypothetical protein [Candidatus Binatia bacterium]